MDFFSQCIDLIIFFQDAQIIFKIQIDLELVINPTLKIFSILSCNMVKLVEGEEEYKTINLYMFAHPRYLESLI